MQIYHEGQAHFGNKTLNRIAGYDDSVRKTVGCGGALCATGGDARALNFVLPAGKLVTTAPCRAAASG